jgi:hypothetical protein
MADKISTMYHRLEAQNNLIVEKYSSVSSFYDVFLTIDGSRQLFSLNGLKLEEEVARIGLNHNVHFSKMDINELRDLMKKNSVRVEKRTKLP